MPIKKIVMNVEGILRIIKYLFKMDYRMDILI